VIEPAAAVADARVRSAALAALNAPAASSAAATTESAAKR